MRIHKLTIYITGIFSIVFFIVGYILAVHPYMEISVHMAFWYDVFMGIFSGAILTLVLSIVGYFVERKKTFENFWVQTLSIVGDMNKYQESWDVETKIDFFLKTWDFNYYEWDNNYANFDFLFDLKNRKRKYIYSQIYKPYMSLRQAIGKHVQHFRWHKDGSGRNEAVMQDFIKDIEPLIIYKENYQTKDGCDVSCCKNIFVEKMYEELDGEFYKLMYGKRKFEKM